MSEQTPTANLVVEYLHPEDINVAASVLYKAYHDDPLLKQVLEAKHELDFEKSSEHLSAKNFLLLVKLVSPWWDCTRINGCWP